MPSREHWKSRSITSRLVTRTSKTSLFHFLCHSALQIQRSNTQINVSLKAHPHLMLEYLDSASSAHRAAACPNPSSSLRHCTHLETLPMEQRNSAAGTSSLQNHRPKGGSRCPGTCFTAPHSRAQRGPSRKSPHKELHTKQARSRLPRGKSPGLNYEAFLPFYEVYVLSTKRAGTKLNYQRLLNSVSYC